MIQLLERIGIVKNERNSFQKIPAIVLLVLMLTFVGTTFYILISSLTS